MENKVQFDIQYEYYKHNILLPSEKLKFQNEFKKGNIQFGKYKGEQFFNLIRLHPDYCYWLTCQEWYNEKIILYDCLPKKFKLDNNYFV